MFGCSFVLQTFTKAWYENGSKICSFTCATEWLTKINTGINIQICSFGSRYRIDINYGMKLTQMCIICLMIQK